MSNTWADLAPAWHAVGPTWAGIFGQFVYKPQPQVILGTQPVSGILFDRITIRRGRDSIYVEQQASYATLRLRILSQEIAEDFLAPSIINAEAVIGQTCQIRLNGPTGVFESIFFGRISDVVKETVQGTDTIANLTITAVGPLADANRRQVFDGGRAAETDGERVLGAMVAAFGTAVPIAPQINPVVPAQFDTGLFTVASLDSQDGGYNALRVAQEAAFSAQGIFFEQRDGTLAYADAERRPEELLDGATEIPATVLNLNGIQASSSLSELANRAIVDWDAGTVVEDNVESQNLFGLLERRVSTILSTESDAERFAGQLVQNQSVPVFKADQFRLILNNLPSPLLDTMVRVEPNDAVRFTGLPFTIGFFELVGFVEGLEWSINDFTVELGLFVSDEILSVGDVWWGRVTETLEWDDVDPALEWGNVGRTL